MEYVNGNEFRDEGYLLELNRRFLHPLGMALEVDYATEGKDPSIQMRVQDFRNDSEGIWMTLTPEDVQRGRKVRNVELSRASARRRRLGFWTQPLLECSYEDDE